MTAPLILYPGNDFVFSFGPVLHASAAGVSGTSVDDGTGTVTLLDAGANPVTGANNLPLTALGARGMYSASIVGSGFNPPNGAGYTLVISLTSPTYGSGKWRLPAIVEDRTT